jgi:hypothetical protein
VQNITAEEKLSTQLFSMEPKIRYVAVNQKGKIVEIEQSPSRPSYNPNETDRMEELIVNPIVLSLQPGAATSHLELGIAPDGGLQAFV